MHFRRLLQHLDLLIQSTLHDDAFQYCMFAQPKSVATTTTPVAMDHRYMR